MLQPGDSFGDYRVIRLLGKGGMGFVFLLENAEGSQVAAKILDPATAGDHEARKRFLREAELALGVKHPNLVETYDVGEDPDTGLCYILMEYVSGGSLADRIKAGPLSVNDAIGITYQIASVLELARQRGIVHRDIKPDNIMFGADGKAKLADLGIARGGIAGTETTTVTQTGMMIGTPAYMAPEQMLDAHHVDTRADIYSLGIVFYEMLVGKRPNADDTVVQLMAKAVAGEPIPDVRTMRPEVSAAVAELINLMCAMKADERAQTPAEVTTALSQIVHGREMTIVRKRPRPVAKNPAPRGDSSRKIVAAVFALLAAGGVAAFLYFRPEHRVPPPKPDRAVALQQEIAALPRTVFAPPREVNVVREVTNTIERTVVVTNVATVSTSGRQAVRDSGEQVPQRSPDLTGRHVWPRGELRKTTVDGRTWWYRLTEDGSACLERRIQWNGKSDDGAGACVSPPPMGALDVPQRLDGHLVTGIQPFAFTHCREMTSLNLPEGLVVVRQYAFYWCAGLEAVRLPDSLRVLEGGAFGLCRRLKTFDLNLVESMPHGSGLPEKCHDFKVSERNQVYSIADGVLYASNRTVLVKYPFEQLSQPLPKSVIGIFKGAFCTLQQRTLILPKQVREVCGAFGKSVEEIRFGPNLTRIHAGAFGGSGNLRRVVFEGDAPVVVPDPFHPEKGLFVPDDPKSGGWRNRSDLTVYVRKSSKGWNRPGEKGLPKLWPTDGDPSCARPIRYIEDGMEALSAEPVPKAALAGKTFNLPRKVELQMIGCPAGTFRMGYPNAPAGHRVAEVHEVRFTRPFWIVRHPVTKEQWAPLMGKVQLSNVDRALGGMKAPITEISGEQIRDYCRNLTRRLKSGLPKGYVFRLPTDAEWEYALRGGSEDWADPYVGGEGRDAVAVNEMDKKIRLRRAGLAHLIKEKVLTVGPCEVCTKKPNGWGIYDMLGNIDEWVLDTFPVENPDGSYKKSAADVMGEVTYRAQETDPLRWSEEGDVIGMIRCNFNGGHPELRKFISPKSQFAPIGFRVVLGPDLEKEQRDAARATKRRK